MDKETTRVLQALKTGVGSGVKTERKTVEGTEAAKFIHAQLSNIGEHLKPRGLDCAGYAVVFLYDHLDAVGNARAEFLCKAAFKDGTPEGLADKGMKELARHCMQLYGREPARERK